MKKETRKLQFGRHPTDSGRSCKYYPCHFEGQDCTWCFCPLYPCLDPETGGKEVRSKRTGEYVWSCRDCHWIHFEETAEKLKKIILDGDRLPDRDQLRELLNIHRESKGGHQPR